MKFIYSVDFVSIFPLDFFVALILRRSFPIFRINRLLRKERIQRFMEQTETRSSASSIIFALKLIAPFRRGQMFSESAWLFGI